MTVCDQATESQMWRIVSEVAVDLAPRVEGTSLEYDDLVAEGLLRVAEDLATGKAQPRLGHIARAARFAMLDAIARERQVADRVESYAVGY